MKVRVNPRRRAMVEGLHETVRPLPVALVQPPHRLERCREVARWSRFLGALQELFERVHGPVRMCSPRVLYDTRSTDARQGVHVSVYFAISAR